MQIVRILTAVFLPLFLCGTPIDLLPPGSDPLAEWRFTDWGERSTPKKSVERKHSAGLLEGVWVLTLENTRSERSFNMMYRTVLLGEATERRQAVLRFKAASQLPEKPLLRVQLNIPKQGGKEFFFAPGKEKELCTVETELPKESSSLTVQFTLAGTGKISLSEIELELFPKPCPFLLEVPKGVFQLPVRRPVLFPVKLPRDLGRESFTLHLTLPWGVRFINASHRATLRQTALKVMEKSELQLVFSSGNLPGNTLYLLLDSDLEEDGKERTGSCFLEVNGRKTPAAVFRLASVKNTLAVPPRSLRIMRDGSEKVPALESSYDSDGALFRSGANVLVTPFLRIPPQTLKTARIQHFAHLSLPFFRSGNRCLYQELRDESFWEKHFFPLLRKNLLRNGANGAAALLCEPALGQRRALECLCVLCRAELADFDSSLPRRDVMTLSNGLLQSRYRKALARFRFARLTALRESALVHLPKGAKGFSRSVRLIFVYPWRQIPEAGSPFQELNEAVIDFQTGAPLAANEKCRSAVNYLLAQEVYHKWRKVSPKSRLTAKFAVSGGSMSPEVMYFEMLNYLFSGFTGVWPLLEAGTAYAYQELLGESAALIREYENFFRRGKLREVPFKILEGGFQIPLPPVPGPGNFPLPLPRTMAGIQLKAWWYQNTLLLGVGNFSLAPRRCVLQYTGKEKEKGTVSASGKAELTVPPLSWKFLKFPGL